MARTSSSSLHSNTATRLDSQFLAEEYDLYEELRSCTNEDDLLLIMSDIQKHFREELDKQQSKIQDQLEREHADQIKQAQMKSKAASAFSFGTGKASTAAFTAGMKQSVSAFQFKKEDDLKKDSPEGRRHLALSIPLLTPRTKYGTYRLDLFCDIRFVKNIFVRWISSENEVLSHVTSRTIGVLFSHAYLNSDQMLDLAELLLGVHDVSAPMKNVRVSVRPSRASHVLFGGFGVKKGHRHGDDSSCDSDCSSSASSGSSEYVDSASGTDTETTTPTGRKRKTKKDKKKSKKGTGKDAHKTKKNKDKNPDSRENSISQLSNGDIDSKKTPHFTPADHQRTHSISETRESSTPSASPTASPSPSPGPGISKKSAPPGHKGVMKKIGLGLSLDNIDEEKTPQDSKKYNQSLLDEFEESDSGSEADEDDDDDNSSSRGSDIKRRDISKLPFTVFWNNRLYSAMRILTQIVQHEDVHDDCVVALDEWFATVVLDLLHRCSRASYGILDAFLVLLKTIFFRFASGLDKLPECKTANKLCKDPSLLLNIITRQTSTLVTRSIALELCPLLMATSSNSEKFAQECLVVVLDDGRFNPFEPGDVSMTRTFKRAEPGKISSINPDKPFSRGQTLNEYLPSLLFQSSSDTFVDREVVMRLTFMTVLKAMNSLAKKIDQIDLTSEKRDKLGISENGQMSLGSLKTPKTPGMDLGDAIGLMDAQVDRLEGEFDASTARKIRNWFSRDADYTRWRVLDLCCEEDDILIDVLLELLIIEATLRRSKSRLARRIRYLFDPFLLFSDFLQTVDADHSLLLDWLISNETSFLAYLLRFCKRMTLNWHPTAAEESQVNRVMCILIRLRMQISTLHQRGLMPFNPKSLLKAMERMEFCYENEGGIYIGKPGVSKRFAWTDVGDGNSSSKKKGKNKDKDKKKKEKRKRPKKLVINSLFLQDRKAEEDAANKTPSKRRRKKRRRKKKDESASTQEGGGGGGGGDDEEDDRKEGGEGEEGNATDKKSKYKKRIGAHAKVGRKQTVSTLNDLSKFANVGSMLKTKQAKKHPTVVANGRPVRMS